MSRRYTDPVEVRRGDQAPTEFLWRGRLYLVRDVLAHWMEAPAWWATAEPPGQPPGQSPGPPPGQPPGQPPGHSLEGDREVWRVAAGAGRAAGTGVYDLSFDWARGAWTLARAHD